MTPARRHTAMMLAALQGAATPHHERQHANGYELQLMQLAEHRRRLKAIESIERKIDAKRSMLADFDPWVSGVLAADSPGQDDVLVTVMLWTLDTGDLAKALPMARHVIKHGLDTPDRYERKAATLIAEEVADTGNKLLDAGTELSADLLLDYMDLLAECDMFDQVRAKLFKATARALLVREFQGDKPRALELMKRAVELHDKVGLKKDIEVLARQLRKEGIAEQPAEGASAESVTAPADTAEASKSDTEQPTPADGETS